jgi:uncharacterized protein (DUF2126 family)/transglutaminase-like putative cysteine protease
MAIQVALHHRTRYQYDRPVALSPHIVRLRPAPHCRTPVLSYSMRVQPEEKFVNWQQDPHSNFLARLVFPEKARCLQVDVDLIAEMIVINPFDFFLEAYADRAPFTYEPWLLKEIAPFREALPPTPRLAAYLASLDRSECATVDMLVRLNQRVHHDVRYLIRMEPGVQSPEETLTLGSGSCRDSAWLLVQVLRHLGFAARFVSGYLIQLTADVKSLDGPSGPEQDFTDLHAWTEVYLPGAGWVGLDPTSGLFAGEGHLPLACTPEPSGAAPITGAVEQAEVDFHFEMRVTRFHEDPRVTKPYTDQEWRAIELLGHQVDAELEANDVRLSMGGEPTLVSIDDMDGAEWNTEAMGPHKRALAGDLFQRLQARFAPGALLHFGQGKWYPGEPLPRWSLNCYWRRDGQPVWREPRWVAEDGHDYGHGTVEAERFALTLALRLGVDPGHIVDAFEDVFYYLWKERRLPVNLDPFDSRLEDPLERERLARLFERGLDAVTGFALPIRRAYGGGDGPMWVSGPWFLRSERMYLVPGDSPMGLRLPLDSLPWARPGDLAAAARHPRDPFASRPPLPPPPARRIPQHPPAGRPAPAAASAAPRPFESHAAQIRTALCVEPREGVLHVFMPPLDFLEDYLDLVAAVEDTAAALSLPVRIEGYPPPHDPRINHFSVKPDPGVIEVNIHPARRWDELVHLTTTLYEEARQARLGTEKFMLDGRHTGTGGGNHITIGGPTPADSPMLRRPDLLRSLVTYWNNHPALSFLFSGLFVGPTSQAPRVDEARNDSLAELDIAFAELARTDHAAPWFVDRCLRNLLVDVTGNTHRTEFCIDKLFSPDSASGRQGLVELRAFEMPPHARMSLTQQLLIRSLIAWFWRAPYRGPLVRWGTAVHDRFMLPHWVAQDFADVVRDLQDAGYPFDPDWFNPHFEFRFPRYGTIARHGVHLELRYAIEPWHVLGEEATAGGTSRYVDSSVERMQVKVRGMTHPRHAVTCNGRTLPLHPTGVPGEFVAGVRYRAWQPPHCLHPGIGVHAPLVFDLVDTWQRRSLGGCTYHVAHPGGRNYERFPVNANEAEGRRIARFEAIGHSPGTVDPGPPNRHPEHPFTLDLRAP